MTTLISNASIRRNTNKAPVTLVSLLAALFTVNLRESLDTATGGNKSDATFFWGL